MELRDLMVALQEENERDGFFYHSHKIVKAPGSHLDRQSCDIPGIDHEVVFQSGCADYGYSGWTAYPFGNDGEYLKVSFSE